MTDDAPKKTPDELLQDCATDTAAMLALRRPISIPAGSGEAAENVDVVACCARELESLALRVTLQRMPPRHVPDPRPVTPDTWVADALGVLTLVRTQRFYLAAVDEPANGSIPADEAQPTRKVYPVTTDRPVRVPYELRFRNIDDAWSHRAPQTAARSSAPTLSARRARTRGSRP